MEEAPGPNYPNCKSSQSKMKSETVTEKEREREGVCGLPKKRA